MLAFLPESVVQTIIDEHGLPAFNDATVTDRDALMRRLQDVRDTGVAIVDGEYNQELLRISAPVFDHTSRPRASLTIALISSQLKDRDRIDMVAEQVRQVAEDFSREMGYSKATARE
jgi:DNA-binding IclR family transcriptional regulator